MYARATQFSKLCADKSPPWSPKCAHGTLGAMSPEATTRAVTCHACGYLALRVATVLEAAAVAAKHLTAAGCPADAVLIHPLEVGR